MIVNSDPNTASNITLNGSSFEIQMQEPLHIPDNARNITLAVEESTIWWVVPNIIENVNDKFYLDYDDGILPVQNYIVTVPQGLYDLNGLNQAILRELENQGAPTSPEPLITLTADEATQKVEIRLAYVDITIDFTQPDTMRDILGFNSQIIGPSVIAPQNVLADNVAQFNTVNYFLIHSDLVNKGILINSVYNQTIAQVLINVAPGSQIVSAPFNPARTSISELAGIRRSNIRFYLTDDKNRAINTNGEIWSARIVIRYDL